MNMPTSRQTKIKETTERSAVTCPICNSVDVAHAFEAYGHPILDCLVCEHRFSVVPHNPYHVETVYGDDYFTKGGAGYANYLSEEMSLRDRGRYYARKLARLTAPGRILDVGCAAGFILNGFVQEGWKGVGLEPNITIGAYGRDQLGLDIRHGTLETFKDADQFTAVSMIQVAAHFRDPVPAFVKARRLLMDGGLLLVETWDRHSIIARLLGKHWHEYSPPSVLHWFTSDGPARYKECT